MIRGLTRSASHWCRVAGAPSTSSLSSAARVVPTTVSDGTNHFAAANARVYDLYAARREFWGSPRLLLGTPSTTLSDAGDAQTGSPLIERPTPSLKPAILVCTSKVVSTEQREDYEAWLTEGKTLIDAVLKDKDCQAGLSVPAGRRPLPEGRFSWVHFPAAGGETKPIVKGLKKLHRPESSDDVSRTESLEHVRHSGAPNCETVAVVFQRQDDMERWTHSNRRAEWLKRGERFNGGDPEGALKARANVIDLDDGSLGGWLPATATGDSQHAPVVPSWKVYVAVVLAQYPIYELNMLLFMPGLEAAGDSTAWFMGLTQPARGAVVQSWSSAMAVFITLPLAQKLLRWYGFMGAKGIEGGGTALGAALTAGTAAASVGGFWLMKPHIDAIVVGISS